jgi:predicted ATPase
MISSLQFISGYPVSLQAISNKKHVFNDRITVLFGPNGSGKTTMLRAMADAAGCCGGGWSGRCNSVITDYEIKMQWDEMPVFFQDCYADSDQSFINPDFFESHEMLRSSGEKRIGLVNELIDHLEKKFVSYKVKYSDRPTLLLDEVDNHIGFAGQSLMWSYLFPRLSKKYQLITSSHSIFPLLLQRRTSLRKNTIFEMAPDYIQSCINELGDAIDMYNYLSNEKESVSF